MHKVLCMGYAEKMPILNTYYYRMCYTETVFLLTENTYESNEECACVRQARFSFIHFPQSIDIASR